MSTTDDRAPQVPRLAPGQVIATNYGPARIDALCAKIPYADSGGGFYPFGGYRCTLLETGTTQFFAFAAPGR